VIGPRARPALDQVHVGAVIVPRPIESVLIAEVDHVDDERVAVQRARESPMILPGVCCSTARAATCARTRRES
jgi:hypothetical protein